MKPVDTSVYSIKIIGGGFVSSLLSLTICQSFDVENYRKRTIAAEATTEIFVNTLANEEVKKAQEVSVPTDHLKRI